MSAFDRGDILAAESSSARARRWLKITIIVGLVVNGLLLVIFGFMGAFST
jgi:hypothetical protein